MSKVAVEHVFTGTTSPITSYDATKTSLGSLILQLTGATSSDYFAGPMPVGVARPMEASTAIPGIFPHVIPYSSVVDWVFLADNSTAAATRRIVHYEYNKQTCVFTWKGFITCTFPAATVFTIRGLRALRESYTAGTVSVNGTTVTGTGTTWVADAMSVGSRIGFGTTDVTQVTNWYEISTASTNTSITLTANAGVTGATSYVIEDLKMVLANTNATVGNGGLFIVKGLRIENFSVGGTSITTGATDALRAVYWLKDANTVTNTSAAGIAIEDSTSWTGQSAYVLDTAGRVYKYNLRKFLGVSTPGGGSISAFTLSTGVQAVTGTMSQNNNGRVGVLGHGPGAGINSLYFVTTTRVYRAALSGITSSSITWQSDAMVEIPPGGVNTFAASSTLSSVEIASNIDSLIVMNTGAAGARSYVTKYNTISTPFDKIFLIDSRQLDQSASDSGEVMHPSIQASIISCWSEAGIAYLARHATTAAANQVYAVPLGADWSYASTTNQRLITPSLSTPNASKYYRVYVSAESNGLGSTNIGIGLEPFRIYYRTTGIDDNSGSWTLVPDDGVLNSITVGTNIQFMFEFKTIGAFCIPARIFAVTLTYEDLTTDSHFQPSIGLSSTTNKRFAWRLSTAFGGSIPDLRVRLYDAVSNALLVDDNTATPTGTFEKSTDAGQNWVTWNSTDKANETTYLRFTPSSLGDNIKVRALLTLN